ncbi:hypothetical protein CsSME_00038935 [Camellia sinensis var. sinensis]
MKLFGEADENTIMHMLIGHRSAAFIILYTGSLFNNHISSLIIPHHPKKKTKNKNKNKNKKQISKSPSTQHKVYSVSPITEHHSCYTSVKDHRFCIIITESIYLPLIQNGVK